MKLRHNLRQLQIFQEVVRTGSLSQAARRLGLTQPAVSTAIANLESDVGFLLFRRNHYGTQLTPEAVHLAEGVDKVLASVGHLDELTDGLRDGHAGKLTVASMPGLSPTVMPRVMSRYLADFPRSRLSLQTFSSRKIAEWVAEGQFDLGVIEADAAVEELVLEEYQLCMALAVPVMHPLAQREVLFPQDLAGETIITLDQHHQSTLKLARAFQQAGMTLQASIETHLFPSVAMLVNEGIGIALIDPVTAEAMLARRDCQLRVVPFAPTINLDVALVTSRFHPVSRQGQRFMPYLTAELAAWQQRSKERYAVTMPEDGEDAAPMV
ncbi:MULTISPECIES: LysR family transcriptional regulator [Cobetia]|uniref:LysR family transcriptional regulator n=1 Tax=Cobetia TaxID=204286 RepID=UPI001596F311|nr:MULTISPECIES: LysR family transcriptional regulator [unclassified Cobetia]MDA5564200.1 LysR family transcriptional regulator [Cobetia sp. MMG027]MDH2290144.1 LysR family transcriptional regulator [Cobetia sp. 10Alg 146]MDH2373963.1 LysR family transcriptional regulator [Cobetia sp. 3AK]